MIDLLFLYGTDTVIVRILNKKLWFAQGHGQYVVMSDISGLRLSDEGILSIYPDLIKIPKEDRKKEAAARFQDYIRAMKSEEEVKLYVKAELGKCGYKMLQSHKAGFRPRGEDG